MRNGISILCFQGYEQGNLRVCAKKYKRRSKVKTYDCEYETIIRVSTEIMRIMMVLRCGASWMCQWVFGGISFKFEFKQLFQSIVNTFYMSPEKDFNKQQQEDQGQLKNQTQKLQPPSLYPRNLNQEQFNLLLSELSPLRSIQGTYLDSTNIKLRYSDMAIINTPANNASKNSLLNQIDEQYQQISLVIPFVKFHEDSLERDPSNKDQLCYESFDDIWELEESKQVLQKDNVKIGDDEKKQQQPQQVRKAEQPKQKLKKFNDPFPLSINKKDVKNKVFCKCKKTKCLKLYCDCFREGQVCGEACNCEGCHNQESYQEQRSNAMMSLMERNPDAFKPRLQEQCHSKGCRCRQSHCQKKYCQCFQANLKCGEHCKCVQCKNFNCGGKGQKKVAKNEERAKKKHKKCNVQA